MSLGHQPGKTKSVCGEATESGWENFLIQGGMGSDQVVVCVCEVFSFSVIGWKVIGEEEVVLFYFFDFNEDPVQ